MHSSTKYLGDICYVSGSVLGTGDTMLSKVESPCFFLEFLCFSIDKYDF